MLARRAADDWGARNEADEPLRVSDEPPAPLMPFEDDMDCRPPLPVEAERGES